MKCLNLHGLLEYERNNLKRVKEEDRAEYIATHQPKLREDYCRTRCSAKRVCDFYRKYPTYAGINSKPEVLGVGSLL